MLSIRFPEFGLLFQTMSFVLAILSYAVTSDSDPGSSLSSVARDRVRDNGRLENLPHASQDSRVRENDRNGSRMRDRICAIV